MRYSVLDIRYSIFDMRPRYPDRDLSPSRHRLSYDDILERKKKVSEIKISIFTEVSRLSVQADIMTWEIYVIWVFLDMWYGGTGWGYSMND